MDYDYYDESRTRFQLQSGPLIADPEVEKKKLDLFEVGLCFVLALLCLGFAWYSEGFRQFSLLWLASALFVGPFAPLSATGGVCRVGVGELLPPEEEQDEEDLSETKIFSTHNSKQRRKAASVPMEEPLHPQDCGNDDKQVDHALHHVGENGRLVSDDNGNGLEDVDSDSSSGIDDDDDVYNYDKKDMHNTSSTQPDQNCINVPKGDAEWTLTDKDLLRKLMIRYPKGMLKRWEVIAESFDGSHSVESIVKMSKTVGEKKKSSNDSYSDFLAKRKGQANAITSPLSQRWDVDEPQRQDMKNAEGKEKVLQGEDDPSKLSDMIQGQGRKKSEWKEAEDKALLSALKSFPKETPMRWEKVTLAVPTRTKQQCFRRYTQLKESFRNKLEKS